MHIFRFQYDPFEFVSKCSVVHCNNYIFLKFVLSAIDVSRKLLVWTTTITTGLMQDLMVHTEMYHQVFQRKVFIYSIQYIDTHYFYKQLHFHS